MPVQALGYQYAYVGVLDLRVAKLAGTLKTTQLLTCTYCSHHFITRETKAQGDEVVCLNTCWLMARDEQHVEQE